MRFRDAMACLLALAAAATTAQAQSPAPAAGHPIVLELFTSQGCSSCPPADKLLTTYIARADLIALSFSVDYWDHLGWKDTLASGKHTARQKAYGKALGTGNVYTPQLVIDGTAQAVGSNKVEIEKAIYQQRKRADRVSVPVTAVSDGKRVTIDVGAATASAVSATVWLAVVAPKVDVEIKRGENRGKTISYHNVVREISPVGMWSGKGLRIELPASVMAEPGVRCAILLQADDGGRILGATWMTP